MTPVVAFSDKPVGNAPAEIDQVIGPEPPVAVSVVEYSTLTTAFGRVTLVMERTGFTRIVADSVFTCGGLLESWACRVTLASPNAVEVPEITPVVAFSDSPDGRAPAATDHEIGPTPPDADRVVL